MHRRLDAAFYNSNKILCNKNAYIRNLPFSQFVRSAEMCNFFLTLQMKRRENMTTLKLFISHILKADTRRKGV